MLSFLLNRIVIFKDITERVFKRWIKAYNEYDYILLERGNG